MAKAKKFSEYVERKARATIVARTVRAPSTVWERIEKLAEKNGINPNLAIIIALEKVLDEEGST